MIAAAAASSGGVCDSSHVHSTDMNMQHHGELLTMLLTCLSVMRFVLLSISSEVHVMSINSCKLVDAYMHQAGANC